MSNDSSKEAQKSDNVESHNSKENNIDTDNQNEENEISEEKEDDETSKNENIDKNIPINYNEQNSIEKTNNINETKKIIKDDNKQIENENVIENNKEIIKLQNDLKINEEKDKKIKEYEEKIKKLEERLLIFNEKDKAVQRLTKMNLKLKNSLELVSKKMDEKIHNTKTFKGRNNNSNFNKPMSNLTYENMNKNEFNKKNNGEMLLKEKELNNAINMIKILKFDNQRLQNKLDEIEQNKEIEKEIKDKKQILIEKELQEHKICKQKIENYQETIRKLTEKNRNLMDKIIYGKNKKGNNTNLNNNYNNESSESDGDNGVKLNKLRKQFNGLDSSKKLIKGNLFNIKKLSTTKKFNNSLPKINCGINKQLNPNNSTIININNIFNGEEMIHLNKIFFKNTNAYNIILKKLEILQKSKDSLENKYKLEQKQFTKRIYSMQQQIDYLNTNIREREIKINIIQAQLNESKIENKQLLKRIKILTEGFELKNNKNEENFNNKNENQVKKKKKNKIIKFNKNKNQHENSIDNSEIKGQKINNSIELGNEGESISGENFFEETNKNKNKDNDNSEKNSIYSND